MKQAGCCQLERYGADGIGHGSSLSLPPVRVYFLCVLTLCLEALSRVSYWPLGIEGYEEADTSFFFYVYAVPDMFFCDVAILFTLLSIEVTRKETAKSKDRK